MPESPSRNHPVTAVAGGASAEPTPANNVGGGAGWGDKAFSKGGTDGGHEGTGHVAVRRHSIDPAPSYRAPRLTSNKPGHEPPVPDGQLPRLAGPEDPS